MILKDAEGKGSPSYYNWDLSCSDAKGNEVETGYKMWNRRVWFLVYSVGRRVLEKPIVLGQKDMKRGRNETENEWL